MSHKKHENYEYQGGYGFNNNYIFMIIILILIVLQWFRVGGYGVPGGVGGVGGPAPGSELGLMANGGLFIIALFILIACSCFKPMGEMAMCKKKCHH